MELINFAQGSVDNKIKFIDFKLPKKVESNFKKLDHIEKKAFMNLLFKIMPEDTAKMVLQIDEIESYDSTTP
jgi:hypothetical protein